MKKSKIAVIILFFIGALALRIYNIYGYDLWFDELVSNYYSYESIEAFSGLSGNSLADYFLKRIAYDPSSVFYYLIIYVYSFLFGAGQTLRLLSAAFSILALGIFYRLSRLFFDKKVSVYAALIMALSPMQIWYAQEARVYAMAVFLVLLTVYSYIKALRTEKLFYLILFALSLISACYASYFSVFLLPPMIIMFFWNKGRKSGLTWVLTAFLALFLIIPLFFVFSAHLNFIRSSFWLSVPSLRVMLNTFAVFILGYSSAMWQIYTAPTIFIGLYIYGLYSYFCAEHKNALILSLFFLLPIAITCLISRYIAPIYLDRQLFIYSPFYYLLIAKGVLSIKTKLFKRTVMVLVAVYIGASLINYYHGFMLSLPTGKGGFYAGVHAKKNYNDSISFIDAGLRDKDAILATDIQSYVIITSYFKGHMMQRKPLHVGYFFYPYVLESCVGTKAMAKSLGIRGSGLKTRQLYGWWFNSGRRALGEIKLKENDIKRIWLVSSTWHLDGSLSRNSRDIKKYISGRYKNVLSMEKDGIYIDLFQVISE